MDRWKADGRGGNDQRREEKRRRKKKEDQRRERVRRKKMQVREKVEKSQNTVFFRCFVAPEGRRVGSLKRRARSHLGRWVIKNFHAIVARSRFRSQYRKTPHARSTYEHFWTLRCWKSAPRCGAKHISKSKCRNHLHVGDHHHHRRRRRLLCCYLLISSLLLPFGPYCV